MGQKIAIIDDNRSLCESLRLALTTEGFEIDTYVNGEDALQGIQERPVDLALLDILMPRLNGFDVLRRLRRLSSMPVIFLTSKSDDVDETSGLDLGADDYLPKPFDVNELQARIRALLRRSSGRASNQIVYGDLEVDQKARAVSYQGQSISLSRREYNLLEALLSNQGKVMSRANLEQTLYSWDEEIESNALEVHIHNLRKKISSKLIKTVRGVGYMVAEE